MRTDDLIKALAADAASHDPPVGRVMSRMLIAAGVLSVLLFSLFLRIRPDITTALTTWRFDLKLTLAAALALAAGWLVLRLARPTADARPAALAALAVPLVLIAAVVLEMALLPASQWRPHAIGTNALWCLFSIPFLALAPLAAILYAMRNGAPNSPARAGAAAGLFAGALAAGLYGLHCFDDSPLFVVIWYPLAIAIAMLAGAVVGARVLRW